MVKPCKVPAIVHGIIRAQLKRPVSKELKILKAELMKRHPHGIVALLFYGSCLRLGCSTDSIADIYVIVDSYRSFYDSLFMSISNFIVPPNVFYLETNYMGKILRLKYSVISISQLERATSSLWFHSYFWARCCQPMQLVYCKDGEIFERIKTSLCRATYTFASRIIPCMNASFTIRDFWLKGLELTYMAEIRPEGKERAASIWQTSKHYFKRITPYVLNSIQSRYWQISTQGFCGTFNVKLFGSRLLLCTIPWFTRITAGKILSILRLVKAAFTFGGGVDYALWKIERHTGVRLELNPFLRRHPILAMVLVSWKLLMQRAIR